MRQLNLTLITTEVIDIPTDHGTATFQITVELDNGRGQTLPVWASDWTVDEPDEATLLQIEERALMALAALIGDKMRGGEDL